MRKHLLIFRRFALVGQLGFSIAAPVLLCLFLCWLLVSRGYAGQWIYLPGILLGLGGAAAGLWKLYQSVMKEEDGQKQRTSFNEHR